jgi:hypothetical protein
MFQFGVSALAVFSGGAYYTMRPMQNACFVAGTMVHTATGLVAIEDIKAGDRVLSINEKTGGTGEKPVLKTFVNESSKLVHLFVNGEVITTTPSHLFYDVNKGWTPAASLTCGSVLMLSDSSSVKASKATFERLEKPVKVFNFEVADWHTYYVGTVGVSVHNDCEYRINSDGEIVVTDWKDYPEGQPKPGGTLRLIDGDEYDAARRVANAANRNIHNTDPSLAGQQIHEVKPVKWGGSPTDTANKIALPPSEHYKLTGWWKTFQAAIENNSN